MSIDPQNPYQTPDFKDVPPGGFGYSNPSGISSSILTQQRVVAILMILQGLSSLLMGLFYVGMAFVLPTVLAADLKRQGAAQMEQMQTVLLVTYVVMGLCGILPGLVQVVAGFQNIWLRGYVLGMIGLGAGVVSFGTCYCLPTAVGLLIYGLIIYLNQTTKLAFELARQGQSYDQIMRQATH